MCDVGDAESLTVKPIGEKIMQSFRDTLRLGEHQISLSSRH